MKQSHFPIKNNNENNTQRKEKENAEVMRINEKIIPIIASHACGYSPIATLIKKFFVYFYNNISEGRLIFFMMTSRWIFALSDYCHI